MGNPVMGARSHLVSVQQQHDACRGVGWGGVRMSSPTAEEPARGALLAYIAGLVVLRFDVQMVF